MEREGCREQRELSPLDLLNFDGLLVVFLDEGWEMALFGLVD